MCKMRARQNSVSVPTPYNSSDAFYAGAKVKIWRTRLAATIVVINVVLAHPDKQAFTDFSNSQ